MPVPHNTMPIPPTIAPAIAPAIAPPATAMPKRIPQKLRVIIEPKNKPSPINNAPWKIIFVFFEIAIFTIPYSLSYSN